MSRSCEKITYNLNNYSLIKNRELGFKRYNGYDDDISKKFYTNMDAPDANDENNKPLNRYVSDQGGIFNLEFSQDG